MISNPSIEEKVKDDDMMVALSHDIRIARAITRGQAFIP